MCNSMAKFTFDVWKEVHGTVVIEADDVNAAWEKLDDQKYDVDLIDDFSDREACLIDVEEDD